MLMKTQAIVLHAFKYGEARVIAELFTREAGRVAVIVGMPKTSRGRMGKQLFQPMTLLDVQIDLRQQRQLQALKDARIGTPYVSVPFEPAKLSMTLFVAEFLYHALRGEQRNEPLFDYISDSMQWLDAAPSAFANFHLTFLMRLSRFLGFYPNLNDAGDACIFDLRSGCFSPSVPLHHDFLPPADARRISTLMRMDYPSMHLFRLSRVDRQRIIDTLLRYYRLHLPDFPELRSLQVLQELWQ